MGRNQTDSSRVGGGLIDLGTFVKSKAEHQRGKTKVEGKGDF